MNRNNRVAIEEAALVLRALMDRAYDHPDLARHLTSLPVPGGKPMSAFASSLGRVAVQYPTPWAEARARESADAA